jgi:hypothetical protein
LKRLLCGCSYSSRGRNLREREQDSIDGERQTHVCAQEIDSRRGRRRVLPCVFSFLWSLEVFSRALLSVEDNAGVRERMSKGGKKTRGRGENWESSGTENKSESLGKICVFWVWGNFFVLLSVRCQIFRNCATCWHKNFCTK